MRKLRNLNNREHLPGTPAQVFVQSLGKAVSAKPVELPVTTCVTLIKLVNLDLTQFTLQIQTSKQRSGAGCKKALFLRSNTVWWTHPSIRIRDLVQLLIGLRRIDSAKIIQITRIYRGGRLIQVMWLRMANKRFILCTVFL